jgi:hypothetical protein
VQIPQGYAVQIPQGMPERSVIDVWQTAVCRKTAKLSSTRSPRVKEDGTSNLGHGPESGTLVVSGKDRRMPS